MFFNVKLFILASLTYVFRAQIKGTFIYFTKRRKQRVHYEQAVGLQLQQFQQLQLTNMDQNYVCGLRNRHVITVYWVQWIVFYVLDCRILLSQV